MIAKTTAARTAELVARVKSLHSYSVPCIVSLAVEDGHPPFLDWIARSVESS
jgi:periplasmic divalent cation tolerance protein